MENRINLLEEKVSKLEAEIAAMNPYTTAEEVATEVSRRLNQIRSERGRGQVENRIKELMEATIEKIGKFIKQTPCDTSGIRDLAETLTILERIYRDV